MSIHDAPIEGCELLQVEWVVRIGGARPEEHVFDTEDQAAQFARNVSNLPLPRWERIRHIRRSV